MQALCYPGRRSSNHTLLLHPQLTQLKVQQRQHTSSAAKAHRSCDNSGADADSAQHSSPTGCFRDVTAPPAVNPPEPAAVYTAMTCSALLGKTTASAGCCPYQTHHHLHTTAVPPHSPWQPVLPEAWKTDCAAKKAMRIAPWQQQAFKPAESPDLMAW